MLEGADVFIGVSAPGVLKAEWIRDRMADEPIVFPLANPDPEIDPAEAGEHAKVVASGRSDYPNQINNVLAFPGVFRGLLDAGAEDITTEMLIRAADAISGVVTDEELNPSYIIPSVFHADVTDAVATAIAGEGKSATGALGSAANTGTGHVRGGDRYRHATADPIEEVGNDPHA